MSAPPMDDMDSMDNVSLKVRCCWNCKIQTTDKLLVCGLCKTAYYCDSLCQRNNWHVHKQDCHNYKGKGQLRHRVDEFIKTLNATNIPSNDILGYFVMIKDTKKFMELVDNGLNMSTLSCTSSEDNNCYTCDESIFVSFTYVDIQSMIENFDYINYLTDIEYDIDTTKMIFDVSARKGRITTLVYAHDLKHYTINNINN